MKVAIIFAILLVVVKVRSFKGKKLNTNKAVYGQLYEDTKNDVNKAIENAILEASKEATDEESDIENNKEKKHRSKLSTQPRKSTVKVVSENKAVDDDDGSSEAEEPKKMLKPIKHIKKFKPKESEASLKVVDAAEPDKENNLDEEEEEKEEAKEAEDDDEPEENQTSKVGKNDEKIPANEGKADSPSTAATNEGKTDSEEGQEDLKQLLDESITNLIKANSAVEVLLRATNGRIQPGIQSNSPNSFNTVAANGRSLHHHN